jgi:hypothetical protein
MWTLIAFAIGIAAGCAWPPMHRVLRGLPGSNQDFLFY